MNDDDPRHGTVAGYHGHIRAKRKVCPSCRAAATAYNRAKREREAEREIALVGGRWVPVGGIVRWEVAS